MAYIGQQPVVGRYILLDQISGGFNGTTSGFTMSTAGGVQGVNPGLAQNVLLSLGGVIQQPGVDYTISGSGITFTTPPVAGTTFFATVLGDAQSVGTPSDGTVTPASIAAGFDFAFPNVNVTGVTTIASGVAATPSLSITGDADTGLFSSAANSVSVSTGGSERLKIDDSGRLLIGSSVAGNADADNINVAGAGNVGITFRGSTSGTGNIFFADSTSGDDLKRGQIVYDHSGNSMRVHTNAVERMRIDSSGNVGIGATSPSAKLHIAGTTRLGANDATDAVLEIGAGATGNRNAFIDLVGDTTYSDYGLRIQRDNSGANTTSRLLHRGTGDFRLIAQEAAQLEFWTSNTERLSIDSSGRVGIGTTSPGNTLHLKGAEGVGIRFENSTSTNNSFLTIESGDKYQFNVGGSGYYTWVTGGSEKVRIDSSGRLLIGTSTSPSGGDSHAQNAPLLIQGRIGSDADSGRINLQRGSAASNGSSIGSISFTDSSNNAYARIEVEADAVTGTDDYPGRIKFSTTADGASSPTTALTINRNGMLGINETNPGHYIDMNIGSNNIGMKMTSTDAGSFIQFADNNTPAETKIGCEGNEFVFDVNGSEKVRINSTGNVGIGTSSVDEHLHVEGSGSNERIKIENTTSNVAGLVMLNTSRRYDVQVNGSAFQIYDNTGSAERLRIDSSGRVGIGTASPAEKLSVDGKMHITNDIILAQTNGRLDFDNGNSNGALRFHSTSGSAERMRISSAGNVGIGTSSPRGLIHLHSSSAPRLDFTNTATGTGSGDGATISVDGSSGALNIIQRESQPIQFYTSNTERMRLTSAGHLGIATTSPPRPLTNADDVTLTTGNAPQFRLNGTAADGDDDDRAIFGLATASNHFFGTAVAGDAVLRTTNGGNLLLGEGTTERMRITSTGDITVAKTTTSINTDGIMLGSGGLLTATRSNSYTSIFNRGADDGQVIVIAGQNTHEGSISVSGSTVSYNGGHLSRWSQLAGGAERTEILRGSVLSNLDEMCEWGEEDNEQLNRMKVSDIEGDANVSGVFQGWDDDDDTYTNDFYCAMTGDFVIRIAQGTTVARGDLLMSAGDGTAKPQDDDIVRSKTIAKVTSTTVSTTYSDGSYCVPCVLMAC